MPAADEALLLEEPEPEPTLDPNDTPPPAAGDLDFLAVLDRADADGGGGVVTG